MTTKTEILATIASALNPSNPEETQHGERSISHTILSGDDLTVYVTDGTQFKITVEEML